MGGASSEKADRIRVLIVDDHHVLREGLGSIIDSEPDMTVVAEAEDGEQAVARFREHRPDVTLMDLRMPGMGGVEATAAIQKEHPGARIVVLTTYDGDEDIYRALQAGARAYLLKDTRRKEVLEAIRAVHAGQRRIPEAVAQRLAERMGGPELTSREVEVLELMAKGLRNRDIGTTLDIAEGTVKVHVKRILSKLGVEDRAEAIVSALQRGIIHLE